MSEEVAVYEAGTGVAVREHGELSVNEIISKVAKVREVAACVMKDGIHYGTIPGTPKPTLYKAGGEILALTFRLAPRYEGERLPIDLGDGHREYIIRCELFHITTGAFIAAGMGSCSTMESKYRYRPGPVTPTGKAVPRDYWDQRKTNPPAAQASIGGKGHSVKKIDGSWQIVIAGEPIDNPNIADVYNTVLKIAAKRSYIDAILKATAASEVYTQDMEDITANERAREGNHNEPAPAAPTIAMPKRSSRSTPEPPINAPFADQPNEAPPPIIDEGGMFDSPPMPEREPGDDPPPTRRQGTGKPISDPQGGRLYAKARSAGLNDAQLHDELLRWGFESTKDVTRDVYEEICAHFDGMKR